MIQTIDALWVELTGASALAGSGATVRYFEGQDTRPVYIKDGPVRPENNVEDAIRLDLHDERVFETFDTTLWVRTAWGQADIDITELAGGTAALLAGIAASQAAQDALIAAIEIALSPDNATQAELDAAVSTLTTGLAGKVDQTVFDALVAGNATDAELAVLQAAVDAEQAAQDLLINENMKGQFLGLVSSDGELTALTAEENDWFRATVSFVSGGTTFEPGRHYWDGTDWAVLKLDAVTGPSNTEFLFGTVDADALMASFGENQALHFQVTVGGASITTAGINGFGALIDGDATGGNPSPLLLPGGVQGYLTKNATGDISVTYTTSTTNSEGLDHDVRYRIYADSVNANGQPAIDGAFPIQSPSTTVGNRFVTDNGNNTYTVTAGTNAIDVIADFRTLGTGAATRLYYIHDSSQPTGSANRVAGSTIGTFGQGSAEAPAVARIPAGTTVTIGVRSVSSGNNQVLQAGSFLDFTEVLETSTVVASATGYFRLNRHEDIGATLPATIATGHDLTQAPNMALRIFVRDAAADRGWQLVEMDVDNALAISALSTNDGFALAFDNDFITVDIINAATGEITFTDNGRDLEYGYSELWVAAATNAGVEEIPNVALAGGVTSTTYENLGDPNTLYTGADGDKIHVEYGDNNRDTFVFLNGAAMSERKGQTSNDIQLQIIAGGQVQIRHVGNGSGVNTAWYEWKDGVVRTTKSVVSSDCSLNITDLGSAQEVSIDPIAVSHYLNNRRSLELVFAKEGTSSQGINVTRYSVDTDTLDNATYDGLQNATDNGNGSLGLNGGINGNFNRRARTVEHITAVGDYFQFTVGAFSNGFAGTWIALTDVDPQNAESATGEYRMQFTGAAANYTLRDPSNTIVASGVRGTFRIMQTLYGIKFSVNGVEVYSSPKVDFDYFASLSGATDNFMRAGSLFSTADGNETFAFDTPFDGADGTVDGDIQVFLQRKNQPDIDIILAPQNITLAGFDIDRDNNIDGVGTQEPFSYVAFNVNALAKTNVNEAQLSITNPNETDGDKVLKPNGDGSATFQDNTAPVFDTIPEFSAAGKVGFEINELGQPYTLVEDVAGTVTVLNRSVNTLTTPYVEVELRRDTAATHGVYVRANTTGGRQSQVRMSLSDGTVDLANSGANTALPTVLKTVVGQYSIKHTIQFNDPVAHTDLEIAPAGTDAALTPTPAQTGQTGILGIKTYETNPLVELPSGSSAEIKTGTDVAGTVTFAAPFTDTNYRVSFGTTSTTGIAGAASITNKTAAGFTFIHQTVFQGSGAVAPTDSADPVDWTAIRGA